MGDAFCLKSTLPWLSGRSAGVILAAGIPALLAAGCAATNTVSQAEKSFTERLLFANTKLPEQKSGSTREYGCPAISIVDGTVSYRGGDAATARGVTHQASIHDLARECRVEGTMMRVKVGIQGRLVLGENGKPGTYTIPVRIAVRGNGQTIYSKLIPTTVTLAPGDSQSAFVVIDEGIVLPLTAEDPGEAYSILTGLDPQGARETRRKSGRRR